MSSDANELFCKPNCIGVNAKLIGQIAVSEEKKNLIGKDSSFTSILSLILIVVFLFVLTRSIKGTFFPLITVILGIIWTLGITGFFKFPYNSITSSVVTITIGIGIDFGLQLMNRFEYEVKKNNKVKAMEITISNILTPMIATVAAALIGFQAMKLGELSLMGDLGNIMGISIACCMAVSITAISSIIILFYKPKK